MNTLKINWISINDLLPDEGQEIIAMKSSTNIIDGESSIIAGIYYSGRIEICKYQSIIINNVTHWIPVSYIL